MNYNIILLFAITTIISISYLKAEEANQIGAFKNTENNEKVLSILKVYKF